MKGLSKVRVVSTIKIQPPGRCFCPVRPLSTSGQRNVPQAAAASMPNANQSTSHHVMRHSNLTNPDPAHDSTTARIVGEQAQYMLKTYARPPPMFVKGEGCYLWDVENRQYLDLTAGIAVNALGHCDPGMTAIIAEQSKTLIHASNLYHNPWTGALSQLLIEKTLSSNSMHDASSVFICNSGTEANEAALKFARKVGKTVSPDGSKFEIVSFQNSFHGRTLGALSATPNPKYQKPFAPMIPGFRYGTYNDIDAINDLVTEATCGVIVEPIQGEGGVIVATEEFLTALAKRCREVGAVLIYDEIQCGLSRTGTFWAHANLPKEAHPDIISTAKALGNGFPIGATIVNQKVADAIAIGDHGTTFGGNPLGSRIAHYLVERYSDPALQSHILAMSNVFRKHMSSLKTKYPDLITEIRGRGLHLGLQLSQDPTPIVTAARERGLLIITAGTNTLRFVPSYTISEEQVNQAMRILEEAIKVMITPGREPKGQQVEGGEVDAPN